MPTMTGFVNSRSSTPVPGQPPVRPSMNESRRAALQKLKVWVPPTSLSQNQQVQDRPQTRGQAVAGNVQIKRDAYDTDVSTLDDTTTTVTERGADVPHQQQSYQQERYVRRERLPDGSYEDVEYVDEYETGSGSEVEDEDGHDEDDQHGTGQLADPDLMHAIANPSHSPTFNQVMQSKLQAAPKSYPSTTSGAPERIANQGYGDYAGKHYAVDDRNYKQVHPQQSHFAAQGPVPAQFQTAQPQRQQSIPFRHDQNQSAVKQPPPANAAIVLPDIPRNREQRRLEAEHAQMQPANANLNAAKPANTTRTIPSRAREPVTVEVAKTIESPKGTVMLHRAKGATKAQTNKQAPEQLGAMTEVADRVGNGESGEHFVETQNPIQMERAGQHPAWNPEQLEADQLDHDPDELFQMDYATLKNEPFDNDPRHPGSGNVFASLNLNEWERAGDWFFDQFSEIMQKLKAARQQKRELELDFEAEIEKRHQALVRKREVTDEALNAMKKSGGQVLAVTPKKKQKCKG
ncbi:hypothetical protein H2203_002285 [Taxawa tesnikishii (nom. ined.)]|nr:hypothetical protein H2203_002285 [Dothideales sp. JES 119]